jgi:hypothetical protein
VVDYVESPLEQIRAIFLKKKPTNGGPPPSPIVGPCHDCVLPSQFHNWIYVNIGPGRSCYTDLCGVFVTPSQCCPAFPTGWDQSTGVYPVPSNDFCAGNGATSVTITWAIIGTVPQPLPQPYIGAWLFPRRNPYPPYEDPTHDPAHGIGPDVGPIQVQVGDTYLSVHIDQSTFEPGAQAIGDSVVFAPVSGVGAMARGGGEPAPAPRATLSDGAWVVVQYDNCPPGSDAVPEGGGFARRAGYRLSNVPRPRCGEFG